MDGKRQFQVEDDNNSVILCRFFSVSEIYFGLSSYLWRVKSSEHEVAGIN